MQEGEREKEDDRENREARQEEMKDGEELEGWKQRHMEEAKWKQNQMKKHKNLAATKRRRMLVNCSTIRKKNRQKLHQEKKMAWRKETNKSDP